MTVYVDVLFVINFFITYLLLMLTKALTKANCKTFRMLAGAFTGGIYSLVIFAPSLSALVTVVGRIGVSFLIILITFGFNRLFVYLKTVVCFYFSNIIFLGVILALWFAVRPNGLVINNDIVYFDIPAYVLLIFALAAYIISSLIIKLYNHTISKKEIYSLKVIKNDKEYKFYAFADSGNKLVEPFSGYPVIVADERMLQIDTPRIIPYNTVGGEGMLKAFKPDKVVISNGKNSFETSDVYVAVSKLDSKDFTAILNPQILG